MVNMQKDTEQLILDCARKHFIQKGFAATRMQEIADEAGINKAMLHYYFRSKEKMYQQIISGILGMMIPKLAGALSSEGTLWDRIDKLVNTYITALIEHPEIPIFIMTELSQKRESFVLELKKQASYFPMIFSFLQTITDEIEAGKIKDFPPLQLLLNILAMSVFPFMAKPVFSTIFDVSESQFEALMEERKRVIVDFVRSALEVN
jgi:AcrR family transcriptional regulator